MSGPGEWITWQLADSAFPSGGFAHSAGIEAAVQAGLVVDESSLRQALKAVLSQITTGVLPLVRVTAGDPSRFESAERRAEASLCNHVARRASRAQGQALLTAAPRVFGEIEGVAEWVQACRARRTPGHLGPVFGHLSALLGLDENRACELFVFLGLRSMLSAVVRLGVVGPLRAQAILHEVSAEARDAAAQTSGQDLDDVHQTLPRFDLLQAGQDRLYSRLFQS